MAAPTAEDMQNLAATVEGLRLALATAQQQSAENRDAIVALQPAEAEEAVGLGGAAGHGLPVAEPQEAERRMGIAERERSDKMKHAMRSISHLPKYDGLSPYRIFEAAWTFSASLHYVGLLELDQQKLALLSSMQGLAIERTRLARPGQVIYDGTRTLKDYALEIYQIFSPPQESELSKSEFISCTQSRREPITTYLSTKFALYENGYPKEEQNYEFLLTKVIAGIYSNVIKRKLNDSHPTSKEELRVACISAVARERFAFDLNFGESTSLDGLAASTTLARGYEDEAMQIGSMKSIKCFSCGEYGHTSRRCHKKSQRGGRGGKNSSTRGKPSTTFVRKCYNCEDASHIAKDCPKPPRKGKVGGFQKYVRGKRTGEPRGRGRGRGYKKSQYHKTITDTEEGEQQEDYKEQEGYESYEEEGAFLESTPEDQ